MTLRPPDGRGGDERGQLAERAALVGAPADRRPDQDRRRRRVEQEPGIASGSVVSALAATVRQPLRAAVATSAASARSEAATTARRRGGRLRDLEPREVVAASRTTMPRRRGERRVGVDRAFDEDVDRRRRARRRPGSASEPMQAPARRRPGRSARRRSVAAP